MARLICWILMKRAKFIKTQNYHSEIGSPTSTHREPSMVLKDHLQVRKFSSWGFKEPGAVWVRHCAERASIQSRRTAQYRNRETSSGCLFRWKWALKTLLVISCRDRKSVTVPCVPHATCQQEIFYIFSIFLFPLVAVELSFTGGPVEVESACFKTPHNSNTTPRRFSFPLCKMFLKTKLHF